MLSALIGVVCNDTTISFSSCERDGWCSKKNMECLMPVIFAPLRDNSYDDDERLVVMHRDQKSKVYATASVDETLG